MSSCQSAGKRREDRLRAWELPAGEGFQSREAGLNKQTHENMHLTPCPRPCLDSTRLPPPPLSSHINSTLVVPVVKMQSDMMIEVLPVSLHLVRVPRARVHDHMQPILRQLLQPDAPGFLNITLNNIELSVLAPEPLASDFASFAYEDARLSRRRRYRELGFEPVELSEDKWKVIQIPSPGA